MAFKSPKIHNLSPSQLTNIIKDNSKKAKLIDCRTFIEYNDNHIIGSVNVCCSKLIKRRLVQEKISLKDLLVHCRIEIEETSEVVVYDQKTAVIEDVSPDSFIAILVKKLVQVFDKVSLLSGGFLSFHLIYPDLCENKIWKYPGLTTLSQPCLPISSIGATRILPFLYLGSEEDANNRDLLQSHNITYELNVSNKCPKPDFITDGHFLRIPVNDSHNERLLPFFCEAFQFIDKVRESNDSVLVHCLAGISRSPTVAIAYVMRHMQLNCEDAYRYVKAKRASISPNFNFLGQLLEYEGELISERIVAVSPESGRDSASSSQPLSSCSESFLPSLALSTPPPTPPPSEVQGKRCNLSLRISPFALTSNSGSSDLSPTSAMARLQFCSVEAGKENRSLGLPLRPTRLLKEQTTVSSIQEEEERSSSRETSKSLTRKSISISVSKGFRNRKFSAEQSFERTGDFVELDPKHSGYDGKNKKCRVHKISLEKDVEIQGLPSLGAHGTSYSRSDSGSTSGIGSEISEPHDMPATWDLCDSASTIDDGVFSDFGLHSRVPKSPPRQLQLLSSDSGHWSEEGPSSSASSHLDGRNSNMSGMGEGSKGRRPDILFLERSSSDEKRRSFAGTSADWVEEKPLPKRWSLAEELVEETGSPTISISHNT